MKQEWCKKRATWPCSCTTTTVKMIMTIHMLTANEWQYHSFIPLEWHNNPRDNNPQKIICFSSIFLDCFICALASIFCFIPYFTSNNTLLPTPQLLLLSQLLLTPLLSVVPLLPQLLSFTVIFYTSHVHKASVIHHLFLI